MAESIAQEVKEVNLAIKHWAANVIVDPEYPRIVNLEPEVVYEQRFMALLMQLRARIATQHIETRQVTYPTNWIAAIQDRWQPEWLNKWLPINYTTRTFETQLAYPEVELPEKYGFRVAILDELPPLEDYDNAD